MALSLLLHLGPDTRVNFVSMHVALETVILLKVAQVSAEIVSVTASLS